MKTHPEIYELLNSYGWSELHPKTDGAHFASRGDDSRIGCDRDSNSRRNSSSVKCRSWEREKPTWLGQKNWQSGWRLVERWNSPLFQPVEKARPVQPDSNPVKARGGLFNLFARKVVRDC